MADPLYTCCEDGMLSQVPPIDRSGLCPACNPGKPTCAVRGVVQSSTGRVLGMCRHVIVGGKLCGFDGACEHQRNAGVMACETPPTPCPSYGRCTYPDCGHFLDVTRGVTLPLPPDRISNHEHEQPIRPTDPGQHRGNDREVDRGGRAVGRAAEADGALGMVDGQQDASRPHDAGGSSALPAGADASRAALALLPRIDAAIQRIVNGQGCMRIPADLTDPDLVLADCKRLLSHVYGVGGNDGR